MKSKRKKRRATTTPPTATAMTDPFFPSPETPPPARQKGNLHPVGFEPTPLRTRRIGFVEEEKALPRETQGALSTVLALVQQSLNRAP
jgi:hypothetical protein